VYEWAKSRGGILSSFLVSILVEYLIPNSTLFFVSLFSPLLHLLPFRPGDVFPWRSLPLPVLVALIIRCVDSVIVVLLLPMFSFFFFLSFLASPVVLVRHDCTSPSRASFRFSFLDTSSVFTWIYTIDRSHEPKNNKNPPPPHIITMGEGVMNV